MKLRSILKAWVPMEAAWLLMAVEGPFIAAVIARLAEPKLNLAAFGVAFPFAMLFEAPIILIMSASTALVRDGDSLSKLRRFTWALNGGITLGMLLFVLPPVFRLVMVGMDLPMEIWKLIHGACILFLPWPAAIGYRRFHQGILIRHGLTRRVAYGTTLRLVSMGGTALLGALFLPWPGVWIGALAMSTGVTFEAIASGLWARSSMVRLKATPHEGAGLTYGAITRFYAPLATTAILAFGVNPLVSFFLGHSSRPLESLAVMPVVNAFLFIFNTAGFTFQEVAIPFMDQGREARKALGRVAGYLALGASGLLMLVAFTPLSRLWFQGVAGLTPALAAFAVLPLALLTLQPALTVLLSFQRAYLVVKRITRPITWATALEVGGITVVLFVLTRLFHLDGAPAAAAALVLGRTASGAYLLPKTRDLFRRA
ncbi:MAG: hypothetical protein LWX11_00725 [Firmicutes bacterium]|nr:hypothetical protein [Bacillota bacterium]